jgi:ubiquinone/menaquinone biosynthesis C-methylase UbiE/catechol 2,3-dioxygenase-like lactoylglutathione lyase family enzyme
MINIKRLDHVQLCIPIGKEEEAKSFYTGILNLKEIPKPDILISNGGVWFQAGDIQLHVGVEEMSNDDSKRHTAFEVSHLQKVRSYLEQRGIKTQDEKLFGNIQRFSFRDPFGNRIEFLEREADVGQDDKHTTKEAVKAQFSRSAKGYVTSEIHAKGKDLLKLVEIAKPTPEDHVLDVATGGGHVANALAPLVKKVVAFDLTQEILDVAGRFITDNGHQNVNFVQGDAENISFADESFDIITCRIAPHHFPNVTSFVKEVARTLKPGGQFLLIDNVVPEDDEMDQFYNEVEKRRDYSHHRAWKKSEWLHMLEEQGFEIDEWYRYPKTFLFENWTERMHLTSDEKQNLSTFMLNTPYNIKEKFRIESKNGYVYSFQGESILLKAMKLKS